MRIGDWDIRAVVSGMFRLDGGAMFGVVPRSLWSKAAPPDAQNRISMAMRLLVARGGGKTVVVDTGAGAGYGEKLDSIYSFEDTVSPAAYLRELGTAPEHVTDVILTHLHFDHAAGAHVVYHLLDDRLSLGASWLRYRMMDLRENKDLYGVDVFWDLPRVELSSEWVYRNSRGGAEPDERGGFVQAAVPVGGHFHLIGRYEHYATAVQSERVEIETLGLTYRPHRAVSVKLEYRDGDHNRLVAPSGWLASIAVLF